MGLILFLLSHEPGFYRLSEIDDFEDIIKDLESIFQGFYETSDQFALNIFSYGFVYD